MFHIPARFRGDFLISSGAKGSQHCATHFVVPSLGIYPGLTSFPNLTWKQASPPAYFYLISALKG